MQQKQETTAPADEQPTGRQEQEQQAQWQSSLNRWKDIDISNWKQDVWKEGNSLNRWFADDTQ